MIPEKTRLPGFIMALLLRRAFMINVLLTPIARKHETREIEIGSINVKEKDTSRLHDTIKWLEEAHVLNYIFKEFKLQTQIEKSMF